MTGSGNFPPGRALRPEVRMNKEQKEALSMSKIVLTEDELRDALEEETTELLERGSWRHGHSARYRIVRDGRSYAGWFRFHHDDGLQVFGDSALHEVFPTEKTVVVWEHAKVEP